MRVMRFAPVFLCAVVLAACSMNTTTMPNAVPDSDIAGIVRTANQGEVDQGNAALGKASSSEVRAFAQMMVTDHTNALQAANSLFTSRNITPADNDTTRTLQQGSQQTISNLSTYSGAAFDRAYMQAMVDAHQWLLNTMDSTLIPSAHDRQLRDLLTTQRAAVSTHLDRARAILSGLR
jgi:putative membrane protein